MTAYLLEPDSSELALSAPVVSSEPIRLRSQAATVCTQSAGRLLGAAQVGLLEVEQQRGSVIGPGLKFGDDCGRL